MKLSKQLHSRTKRKGCNKMKKIMASNQYDSTDLLEVVVSANGTYKYHKI